MPTIYNRVLFLLALLLLVTGCLLPVLHYAPNRLVSGAGFYFGQLPGYSWSCLVLPLVLLAGLALLPVKRWTLVLTLLGGEALFIAALVILGTVATHFSAQGSVLARTSPGGGLWLFMAFCLLLCGDTINRLTPKVMWRLLLNAQIWLIPLLLLLQGFFTDLSLLKEYANRKEVFDDALLRHLALLAGTLFFAVWPGMALGVLCYRKKRFQTAIFSLLNIIQTIPSVALFGLLIAPLAGLAHLFPWLATIGISGIGVAPALIALVLYALLPLVRGVVSGLQQVPRNIIESAQGTGMSRRQIFWSAEVPLALPVLLTSLRVVCIQTIGMAVIAALIGAGGFGAIIFQGLLSSALDLVLLGVIPVIALAVIVDTLFKLIISLVERLPS